MVIRLLIAGIFLTLVAGIGSIYLPLSSDTLSPKQMSSFQISDRNGVLLREVLSDEEGPSEWDSFENFPPFLVWATLAAEDKRFFQHSGVDLRSLLRAAYQDVVTRKVVSGASTISEQVIRNIFHRPRTFRSKFLEAWYALRLEKTLKKNEILQQYLNRVPYGNQIYGIEAASKAYFGKKASRLSIAESAFLAAIPQSPTLNEPYRHFKNTRTRQKSILAEMCKAGWLSAAEYQRSLHEPVHLVPPRFEFKAPHFCNWILSNLSKNLRGKILNVRTTLDFSLQEMAEKRLKTHLRMLSQKNVTNGAVIIMDNRTGEILAMVGSADFFDPVHDGQVNGALALRSPGSTLKPFTYALALENGMTSATILPDLETHIQVPGGDYTPKNYDEKFHGPVRARIALANSYNVPAVLAQQRIGTAKLLEKLHAIGFASLTERAEYYGPSLTLGDGEVTLLELVRAYRSLASAGEYQPENTILEMKDPMGNALLASNENLFPKKVISQQVAYIISHILSDNSARLPAFGEASALDLPFPCAAKTGTSRDFRDNWTMGYTTEYTVGVWVGNFDASPMHEVSGVTGAAPLFYDIMTELETRSTPHEFSRPAGVVEQEICPLSGRRPGPYCPDRTREVFIEGTQPLELCDFHQQNGVAYPPEYLSWARSQNLITARSSARVDENKANSVLIKFPSSGSVFQIDPVLPRKDQALHFEAIVPSSFHDVTWMLDEKILARKTSPFDCFWILQPGNHKVQIVASRRGVRVRSASVEFLVVK